MRRETEDPSNGDQRNGVASQPGTAPVGANLPEDSDVKPAAGWGAGRVRSTRLVSRERCKGSKKTLQIGLPGSIGGEWSSPRGQLPGKGNPMKTYLRGRTKVALGIALQLALASLVFVAAAVAGPRAVPVNVEPPTVTGTARVGEALTAHRGTWDNNPTTFTYRWLRCNQLGNSCVLLASDGQTYRLGDADLGHTLRVRVRASNADGSATARSEQSDVVVANAPPLTNTSRPTITGEARVGQELSANEGTWSGNPASFAFQWQRCDIDTLLCVDVVGATGRTYGVRAADVGTRLRVQVTARSDTRTGTATSAATAVVQPAVTITNRRPTVVILGVRFTGARVYVRMRICDDQPRNLGILVRETRPGVRAANRRFSTRAAPRPCGAYTRNWLPALRFRGHGRYTITIRVRDVSGLTSAPARRTFRR